MIWFYGGDSFLSVLGTRQRLWELRTTLLVGEARTSSVQAFNNKDCCCAAGFCAAPRMPTAALKQQKFRKRLKHVERGSHVEGLRRNSLNLQFQKFHISIDAMHINIDAKGWFMIGASKREYTFRNNVWRDYFHEFIGIKWCQNKSSVWTFNYSRRNMVSIFFLTLRRVLDKKLCLREICLIEV